MNNGTAVILLELIVVGCGGFYLHQKNPEGFNRVVTDVKALIVSAGSSSSPSPLPPAAPEIPAAPAVTPTPAPPVTAHVPPAVIPAPASLPASAPVVPAAPASPPAIAPSTAWTPPAVLPERPNWTWTTIAGRSYTNVKVLRVDPNSVMIIYDGGGERVPLAFLPPDLQKLFNYTPDASPTPAGPTAAPDSTAASNAAGTSSVMGKMVAGNLVRYAANGLAPVDDSVLQPIRYIALYYSAQWCPPCHAFTPQLVQFYNTFKPAHPDFELIFVSEDHDEGQMKDYMREMAMPWPAISYNQLMHPPGTFKGMGVEAFANNGIPDLVLLDSTGKVLSDSFHGSEYVGPEVVVSDIQSMVK